MLKPIQPTRPLRRISTSATKNQAEGGKKSVEPVKELRITQITGEIREPDEIGPIYAYPYVKPQDGKTRPAGEGTSSLRSRL